MELPSLSEPYSTHADASIGEELAGPAHPSIGGEDVPLIGEAFLVDEVAKSAEGTLALDRSLEPVS